MSAPTPVRAAWTRLSTWMAAYERPVGAPMPGVIPSTLAADRAVVEAWVMGEPMSEKPRYFAWVRQFTGVMQYRAYVRDRQTGRAVHGCSHRHRRARPAEKCSLSLLAQFVRGV